MGAPTAHWFDKKRLLRWYALQMKTIRRLGLPLYIASAAAAEMLSASVRGRAARRPALRFKLQTSSAVCNWAVYSRGEKLVSMG